MLIRILVCLLLLIWGNNAYSQTGKLSGRVLEQATYAPIPGVNVVVKFNGAVKGFAVTDEKGFYSISPLVPGIYTVEFIERGFATVKMEDVPVEIGKIRFLNVKLAVAEIEDDFGIINISLPFFREPPGTHTLDGEQIKRMPIR